jgi:hypothetical protein
VIKLTNIFFMPSRLKLLVQISVVFGHFRKDVESLDIGTQVEMLAFLVMKGAVCGHILAS